MLHTALEFIGIAFFLVGGSAIGNGSFVIPSIMVIGGLAITAFTVRRYGI